MSSVTCLDTAGPMPKDIRHIGAMLRIHLPQNWFSLSDPAMEEALYEIT